MTKSKIKKRNDTPEEWFTNADLLYLGCRGLCRYEDPFLWIPAIHLGFMCIEHYLKVYLKAKGKAFPTGVNGHNLEKLLDMCEEEGLQIDRRERIVECVRIINQMWMLRYVDNEFEGQGLGDDEFEMIDEIMTSVRPKITEMLGRGYNDSVPELSTAGEILAWNRR